MSRRRGFTLIELLVVIAIIAILAAILFPVFARAREKARQASCSSNEKQIMLGILMYVQDYDEALPGAWASGSAGLWSVRIMPYVKNNQLFVCPSNATMGAGWGGYDWPGAPFPTSYGFNCNASGKALCNRIGRIASFTQPSMCIIIGDIWNANWGNINSIQINDGRLNPVGTNVCWGNNRCPMFDQNPSTIHNGGANYGHLDGHVKWYRNDAIYPSSGADASKDVFWVQ
ncbi:MAG: DUF1559 domain-containing protein [Candidatus Berkelbacteria bacterium]|nr:DUF1559 domain-containing protein [Candidatus Berkelbacteria bacterium]